MARKIAAVRHEGIFWCSAFDWFWRSEKHMRGDDMREGHECHKRKQREAMRGTRHGWISQEGFKHSELKLWYAPAVLRAVY